MNSSEHLMKKSLGVLSIVLVIAFLFPLASPSVDAEDDWYYHQLDVNERAIYDAICLAGVDDREIVVNLPTKITAEGNLTNFFVNYLAKIENRVILMALEYNEPLAYWTWGNSKISLEAPTVKTGNIESLSTITLKLKLDPAYEDDPLTTVNELAAKISTLEYEVNKFTSKSTDRRGILVDINNYLTNLITYDPNYGKNNESPFAHDAYGALVSSNHYAVCDGYSKAFLLLCNKMKIPCVIDIGVTIPSLVNHAWNYVQMENGNWYAMDVTWNDGDDNKFFLIGAKTLFETHQSATYYHDYIETLPFHLPKVNADRYDPDPPSYEAYAMILAVAIAAIVLYTLYRSTKKN